MGNLILFSGWDNEYMNWVGDTSKIKEMIECLLGGGFLKYVFIFIPIWGRFPS